MITLQQWENAGLPRERQTLTGGASVDSSEPWSPASAPPASHPRSSPGHIRIDAGQTNSWRLFINNISSSKMILLTCSDEEMRQSCGCNFVDWTVGHSVLGADVQPARAASHGAQCGGTQTRAHLTNPTLHCRSLPQLLRIVRKICPARKCKSTLFQSVDDSSARIWNTFQVCYENQNNCTRNSCVDPYLSVINSHLYWNDTDVCLCIILDHEVYNNCSQKDWLWSTSFVVSE